MADHDSDSARDGSTLTHLDADGNARMVDVGSKPSTERVAVASAVVRMAPATLALITSGGVSKGDVAAVARLAGIMAAKRTPDLIPLCHQIALTSCDVAVTPGADGASLAIRATAHALDRTGVEMEAMVAASVAALTAYDMIKGVDRGATIERVALETKSGGARGTYVRPSADE